MNHFGLSARRPGSLPLSARSDYAPFRFSSQQLFFRFAKVFRGDRQSFFSRREERLCSSLLSKSTTFFRFVKLFVSPWSQSFFFNREERLCSPSLQESTVIFRFREILFRLRFLEPFSLVARSVYAPPRSTSQTLFCIMAKSPFAMCHSRDARKAI